MAALVTKVLPEVFTSAMLLDALHVQYLLACDVMICLGKHSTRASAVHLPRIKQVCKPFLKPLLSRLRQPGVHLSHHIPLRSLQVLPAMSLQLVTNAINLTPSSVPSFANDSVRC